MISRCIITLCAILLCNSSTMQAGTWKNLGSALGFTSEDSSPTIKVLIAEGQEGAMIEVNGKYNIYDPYKDERLAVRLIPKGNYMQAVVDGLKWGEVFPGIFQLKITPDKSSTGVVVNGIQYRGAVYVYQINGKINIVNEVKVEDYVNSILSSSLDEPLGEEVVNALAIATRTEACHQALHPQTSFWAISAKDVGYQGHGVTNRANGVEEAMIATQHLVLSNTDIYEGKVTTFSTNVIQGKNKDEMLNKAVTLADKGCNAAKILEKFYPSARIRMMKTVADAEGPEMPAKKKGASKLARAA